MSEYLLMLEFLSTVDDIKEILGENPNEIEEIIRLCEYCQSQLSDLLILLRMCKFDM